jgi:hypothetical protein
MIDAVLGGAFSEMRIGSQPRSGTCWVIATCWGCEYVCRSRPLLFSLQAGASLRILFSFRYSLGPPQLRGGPRRSVTGPGDKNRGHHEIFRPVRDPTVAHHERAHGRRTHLAALAARCRGQMHGTDHQTGALERHDQAVGFLAPPRSLPAASRSGRLDYPRALLSHFSSYPAIRARRASPPKKTL